MIRPRFIAAAALIAAGGAACASDGPMAPTPAPAATATAAPSEAPRMSFGMSTPTTSWAGQRMTESQLNALLEREKARIDANIKSTQRAYDSLKVVYEAAKKADPTGTKSTYLVCDPLAYKGETKIIGPEGGDIQAGVHKLSIPRGALPYRTVITAEMAVATSPLVRFSPHGQMFNAAAKPRLTMEYKHCLGYTNATPRTIAYVSPTMQWLETPLTVDVKNLGLATANVGHFSGYVIGWARTRAYDAY